MADDSKTADPAKPVGPSDQLDPPEPDEFELGPDGIDPELVALSRKSALRIGPLMSLSLLVFCGYIIFRVYPDLQFSRNDAQPQHFDSAAALLQKAGPEQLVSVSAVLDRSFAVHLAHSQADDGSRLLPAQGSDGALWMMLGGNPWSIDLSYEERYSGRLRRLADMPFYDDLRAHVRKRGLGLRYVSAPALLQLVADNPDRDGAGLRVRDPAGDTIELEPNTTVQVYEVVADKARIRIFPTERLASQRDLSGALHSAGLIPADYQPERGLADSWIYVADISGGVTAARARLTAAKLFSARATPIKRLHESEFSGLSLDPGGQLLMVGNNPVLRRDITWASVQVARSIPSGAMVLVAMEHPKTYWYVLPLIIFLALAGLFFLYALVRSFRP